MGQIAVIEDLQIDFDNKYATINGVRIKLERLELRMLEILCKENKTVSTLKLLHHMYHDKESGGALSNSYRVILCKLRKKLRAISDKIYIETIGQHGYKLISNCQWR